MGSASATGCSIRACCVEPGTKRLTHLESCEACSGAARLVVHREKGISMATTTNDQLTFEPPGPGPWDLDALHFPRPVTAYWADMHPEPFALGYGDMTAFYGAPIQTRRIAYVNGFCYGCLLYTSDAADE